MWRGCVTAQTNHITHTMNYSKRLELQPLKYDILFTCSTAGFRERKREPPQPLRRRSCLAFARRASERASERAGVSRAEVESDPLRRNSIAFLSSEQHPEAVCQYHLIYLLPFLDYALVCRCRVRHVSVEHN